MLRIISRAPVPERLGVSGARHDEQNRCGHQRDAARPDGRNDARALIVMMLVEEMLPAQSEAPSTGSRMRSPVIPIP